jgi:hypothetical protein
MAEDEESSSELLEVDVEPVVEEPLEPEPSGEPLEPRDTVPEPPPPPPEPGTEPPGRARGRVHHPTEELPPPEPGSEELRPEPFEDPSSADLALPPETGEDESAPQLYDFETDEDSLDEPRRAASEPEDAFEDLGPVEAQPRYDEEEVAEPSEDERRPDERRPDERRPDETGEDDLLSTSPEFLDEGSETDEEDLWFEKGPPEDFDFEDEK